MLGTTGQQKQIITVCVFCVSKSFCIAGLSCPTFVQVFDDDVSVAIENLNECWTRPANTTTTISAFVCVSLGLVDVRASRCSSRCLTANRLHKLRRQPIEAMFHVSVAI